MKIELTVNTKPPTISRKSGAAVINRSVSMIDKAKKANEIDYGVDGKNVKIVVNSKWAKFVDKCKKIDNENNRNL